VKAIVFILAFQMLNISVYSRSYEYFVRDKYGRTIIEENQIDSLIEYVAEIVFDFKNAFPEDPKTLSTEHEDNYKAPHTIVKNMMVQLAVPVHYPGWEQSAPKSSTPMHSFYEEYSYLFFREINPPPPKG
jgi:hypothetical protein